MGVGVLCILYARNTLLPPASKREVIIRLPKSLWSDISANTDEYVIVGMVCEFLCWCMKLVSRGDKSEDWLFGIILN